MFTLFFIHTFCGGVSCHELELGKGNGCARRFRGTSQPLHHRIFVIRQFLQMDLDLCGNLKPDYAHRYTE